MIALVLVSILTALLVVAYTYELHRTRRIRSIVKNIPKVKGYPLVGSAFELGSNSVDYLKTLSELVKTLGPILQFWMGPLLYIIITGPKDVEAMLSSSTHLEKSSAYGFLRDWLGHGLISSPATKWRTQRKLLTPAFHFKILESYIDVFNVNTKLMMTMLEKEVGKEKFNIQTYIDKCTLDIICETAMATSVNAQINEESEFPKALQIVSNTVLERTFTPWLFPDFIFELSPSGRRFYKHLEYINNFIDNVIFQKMKMLESKKKSVSSLPENDETTDNGVYSSKNRKVFLDLLLSYAEDPSNQLTVRDIRDEVNTFMFAGHDTTSSAVGFAVYLLGKHPKIQEKVLEEVNTVFGETGRDPDYSDLMNLKYMEQVIKETLRLYPSVPYIGRKPLEDLTLPSGYTIPAGAEVVVMIHQIQRDPEVFSNPEQFNPDNFLPDKITGRLPFYHIPFSAGPRNCIGQKFAMLEVKATLARLIQTYKITSVPPEPLLASEIVLRSVTGINVRLEKRN